MSLLTFHSFGIVLLWEIRDIDTVKLKKGTLLTVCESRYFTDVRETILMNFEERSYTSKFT